MRYGTRNMNVVTESLEKHMKRNTSKNRLKEQQNMSLLSLYLQASHFNQNCQLNQ